MRFESSILVALVIASSAPAQADAGTLIVKNARVWGATKPSSTLFVEQGRFVDKLADEKTARVLDVKGAWVLPGFVDAHAHLISGGQMLERVQLEGIKVRAEVLAAIGEYARAHREQKWILGGRWSYDAFGKQPPTLAELDRVVPDRPVFLESYDGHSAWVNSLALGAAGIDPHGHSGLLLEEATAAVEAKIPSSDDEKRRAILLAAGRLRAGGVTTVYEAGLPLAELAVFESIERALPIRVVFGARVVDDFAQMSKARARVAARKSGRLFVGPAKGFVDGVIESGTACMLAPFADGSGAGRAPMIDRATLVSQMKRAHASDVGLAYHAVGDGAARAVIDALASLDKRPRVRLEHLEVVDLANLDRMRALGIIGSMMPQHATPGAEASGEGTWIRRVGKLREPRAFAFATVQKQGVALAFGSDWPVATFDPFFGMGTATTRQNADGTPKDGWIPGERLSVEAALRAYTEGAADAVGLGAEVGKIATGYRADFVVVDAVHPLVRGSAWFQAKPLIVVVDGEPQKE